MIEAGPTHLTADVQGAGPGSMAAAAAEGADVVAIEALEHIGGNSVWSTGYPAFVNSAMQAEQGITDDEDTFVRNAAHMVDLARDDLGVEWDEDLVRLTAECSSAPSSPTSSCRT